MSQGWNRPYRPTGRDTRAWLRSVNLERRQALLRAQEEALEDDLNAPERDFPEDSGDPAQPDRG